MYERILLPTDGERGADRATTHALELGAAVDATVHAVYVVDESVYSAYSGDEFVQEHEGPESALEQQGEDALDAIREEAESVGAVVETSIRRGDPVEEIVDAGEERETDLIVLGSRVRPGEYRQLLGSVTNRVTRVTERPVTIIKTPDER